MRTFSEYVDDIENKKKPKLGLATSKYKVFMSIFEEMGEINLENSKLLLKDFFSAFLDHAKKGLPAPVIRKIIMDEIKAHADSGNLPKRSETDVEEIVPNSSDRPI